ncbi:glycerol-3-phosphate dehydrogenase [Stenotrophomonas bentonitica]|uniref:glycerol-3-phosphate dehydrogenase n=1 Tax=Stenotrophomonas bentonitica TaxID=1450134 RepID=UPI0036F150C8
MRESFDMLVVGGGINGAGIARDAAGRGLSVCLCEQDDLAAHTSSASTKLIHGGLRYLQQGEVALVRKALNERETLRQLAPHLIAPTTFVLPHARHLRPAWMLRAGLWLYDHLGRPNPHFPPSQRIDLQRDTRGETLQPGYRTGFTYADARVNDARLVVLNALDAHERGADIRTRTRCEQLIRHRDHWWAVLRTASGDVQRIRARCVVNASGPWAGTVLQRAGLDAPLGLRLVQGSHLVVPRLFAHDSAYLFQQPDQRVVFAIPFERDFTLIGTTDTDYDGDPAWVKPRAEEQAYLLDAVNRFLRLPVEAEDIVWRYSGVRPLLADHHRAASQVTRDYRLELDTAGAPLLSVLGGKLTTYRALAEEALGRLSPSLPAMGPAWTAGGPPLPGGDGGDAVQVAETLQRDHPHLSPALLQRLATSYGTRASGLLAGAQTRDALGQDHGGGLHERELDYLITHEWVRTAEDVLWRRSHLGLRLDAAQREALAATVQARVSMP